MSQAECQQIVDLDFYLNLLEGLTPDEAIYYLGLVMVAFGIVWQAYPTIKSLVKLERPELEKSALILLVIGFFLISIGLSMMIYDLLDQYQELLEMYRDNCLPDRPITPPEPLM